MTIFWIISLLSLAVIVYDSMGVGLFGKAIKNWRIAGVVDQSESRKISFLCAKVLNNDINAEIIVDDEEFFLVFLDDDNLTCIDVTEPSHSSYANRMVINNKCSEYFPNIQEPFGAANISYKAKEDVQEVVQYCLANVKINTKQKRSSSWGFLE